MLLYLDNEHPDTSAVDFVRSVRATEEFDSNNRELYSLEVMIEFYKKAKLEQLGMVEFILPTHDIADAEKIVSYVLANADLWKDKDIILHYSREIELIIIPYLSWIVGSIIAKTTAREGVCVFSKHIAFEIGKTYSLLV